MKRTFVWGWFRELRHAFVWCAGEFRTLRRRELDNWPTRLARSIYDTDEDIDVAPPEEAGKLWL